MASAAALCNKCGKSSATKICGRCRSVHYCSRDCQVSDWKLHKQTCNSSGPKTSTPKHKSSNEQQTTKNAPIKANGTPKPSVSTITAETQERNNNSTILAQSNDEQNDVTTTDTDTNKADSDFASKMKEMVAVFPEYGLNSEWFRIARINDKKGFGLFAKKNIPTGTIIIREKPLVMAKDPKSVKINDTKSVNLQKLWINKQYGKLTGKEQSIVCSLSYFVPSISENNEEDSKASDKTTTEVVGVVVGVVGVEEKMDESSTVYNIFNCNCVSMPLFANDERRVQSGLFPLISRINHNCDSNCQRYWIVDESNKNSIVKEERVIAMKNILKNEEIVTNYFENNKNSNNSNVLFPFEKRSLLLKSEFNIDECDCKWCLKCRGMNNNDDNNNNNNNNKKKKKTNSKNSKNKTKKGGKNEKNGFLMKHNEWIEEYNKINDNLEMYGKTDAKQGYRQCKKLLKMVEKHCDGNPQFMYQHCCDTAQFALGLHQYDNAFYYFEKCFEYKKMAQGSDVKPDELEKQKALMLPQKYHRKLKKLLE